jgi:hypothetical protein
MLATLPVFEAPSLTRIKDPSAASDALRHRIEEELGWPCVVAEQDQGVELP